MKRDWEIIRNILQRLEDKDSPNSYINMNDFPDHDAQAVGYNMKLLHQAGYIEAKILNSSEGDGEIAAALTSSMTSAGHDLLDTIRSKTVWTKIKDIASEKGLDLTFDVVSSIGKKVMESMLGG